MLTTESNSQHILFNVSSYASTAAHYDLYKRTEGLLYDKMCKTVPGIKLKLAKGTCPKVAAVIFDDDMLCCCAGDRFHQRLHSAECRKLYHPDENASLRKIFANKNTSVKL